MTDDEYCDLMRAAKRLVPAIQNAPAHSVSGLVIDRRPRCRTRT